MKIREAKDGNGPGDIWGTTVRNKDEELKTFWESSGISYGGLHEVVVVVVVVVVVSHIQRIGCQPEKTTLHGGQSRSWSAEQGKENKRKSLAAYPPPPTPTLLVRRK